MQLSHDAPFSAPLSLLLSPFEFVPPLHCCTNVVTRILLHYTCDSRSAVVGETPDRLTAGLVSNFSVDLRIENIGLDAFLAQLSFALPTRLLEFVRVEPRTVSPPSSLLPSSLSIAGFLPFS